MTTAELAQVLALHGKWLRGEAGGIRAYLDGADLAGADLTNANLTDAYLARANLAGANLDGANLARADLAGADLTNANLTDANLANANLTNAYLAGANLDGAYLAGANLDGAYLADANLTDAEGISQETIAVAQAAPAASEPRQPHVRPSEEERARRYRERHPEVPVVENLDAKILQIIESGKGALDMSRWHSCETTHCRAGWAITLAGAAGKDLETKLDSYRAGAAIYRASTGRIPHFYDSDEGALEDIRRCAAEGSKTP